jgi:hypothetical protein
MRGESVLSQGEEWRAWGGTCVSDVLKKRKLVGCIGLAGGKTVHLSDESVERRGEVTGSRAWG